MLSDDVYRAELARSFVSLKRATAALVDVAEIVSAETPDFVRLCLLPRTAGACPVEIMLRADQVYDIEVGSEFYEDCAIDRFDLFEPLLLAIARGDVIQRRHLSSATGTQRAVETIVTLPSGEVWRKVHLHGAVTGAGARTAAAATVFCDRRYVPYRRS